ncbi:hypothetical protein DPMN_103701 [Dreissena polymorpha]|uniref:Uncharacterized protein n=1 Tax=Dreissena polymorpha TaxID=45954 RepID=A0A9D4H8Z3_DREPO|nr:hypothetical protein DPMN_103701 [Dreissena polymorpha]
MIGKSVFAYKFTRKYRAKAIGNTLAFKIASDRAFYPALQFQRFLVVAKSGDPSLQQWGSMATKTVIITKTTRTGDDETNVNHIVSFSKETECSCKKGRLFVS